MAHFPCYLLLRKGGAEQRAFPISPLSSEIAGAATSMVSISTHRRLYPVTQLADSICALVVVPGHDRAIVRCETPPTPLSLYIHLSLDGGFDPRY